MDVADPPLKASLFGPYSLGAFGIILSSVWSFAAQGLSTGIYACGISMLIYGSLSMGLCLGLFLTSLAEFASAYPSSAGCTYLANQLGGPRWGRLFGFTTGGLHAFGSFLAPAAALVGLSQVIATIGTILNGDWSPTRWQICLIYQGVNLGIGFCCLRNKRGFNLVINLGATLLCVTLFVVIGLLVGLPEHTASNKTVWVILENQTGWSLGIAVIIGLGGPIYGIGPTHWLLNAASDVENPRRSIPIALAIQHIGNITTLFAFYVAVGYGVSDWTAIVSSTYPSPIGAVFQHAVSSQPAIITLLVLMAILSEVSFVSYVTASANLIHGFAMTRAVPGSSWASKIDKELQVPLNCLYLIFGFNAVLGLLYLGSTSALLIILGCCNLSFVLGYMPIFIGYLLTKGQHLGCGGYFRLPRRVSLALAAFNLCFLSFESVIFSLPPSRPVSMQNMNWASLLSGVALIFLMLSWKIYGKKYYQSHDEPVIEGRSIDTSVTGRGASGKEEQEAET